MTPEEAIHDSMNAYKVQKEEGLPTCKSCGAVGPHECPGLQLRPAAQIGGTHYSDKAIQPIDFINANQLGFHEGNIVKYITRYKEKNGLEDLRKVEWYIQDLIKQYKGN